ncbi:hypothetical protein [Streptomyces sp. NPDC058757]
MEREPARPEERLPAGLLCAALRHQGQERVAGFLGPAGDLGEKRPPAV